MNKIIKKIIFIFIVVCTISTISLAGNNITNKGGKGTVTVEDSTKPYGTTKNPYQLILGESLIDIYYAEEDEKDTLLTKNQYMSFEFSESKNGIKAASYMVNHNSSKRRIRLELIGTDESSLRVTSVKGLNYLQAGATTYAPDTIDSTEISEDGEVKLEIQNPFYNIVATEKFEAQRTKLVGGNWIETNVVVAHTTDLGNGYLTGTENTYAANVSTYSTIYVFSKSNLPYEEAYKTTTEQSKNINIILETHEDNGKVSKIDVMDMEMADNILRDPNSKVTGGGYTNYTDTLSSLENVEVIYSFNATSYETMNATNEVQEADSLEKFISKIFISIGDVAVKVSGISKGWGENQESVVTIDSLVFNEYPNTIVDFFGEIGYTNELAKDTLNFWYDVFKAWAIILYIILLIYIGIKTVLLTGTPEQKKVKPMLEGWLEGLLLLMFLPFLFKYLITINDMLVDIIRVNSKYSVHAYYSFEPLFEKWR